VLFLSALVCRLQCDDEKASSGESQDRDADAVDPVDSFIGRDASREGSHSSRETETSQSHGITFPPGTPPSIQKVAPCEPVSRGKR